MGAVAVIVDIRIGGRWAEQWPVAGGLERMVKT